MRTLVIGFIGATLTLALAAPSWAQGPIMNAPSLIMPGKDTCATRHKSHKTYKGSGASGDNQANTLNAQELARLQGGGTAPAPAPMPPGGNNPTSGQAGPFYQR